MKLKKVKSKPTKAPTNRNRYFRNNDLSHDGERVVLIRAGETEGRCYWADGHTGLNWNLECMLSKQFPTFTQITKTQARKLCPSIP